MCGVAGIINKNSDSDSDTVFNKFEDSVSLMSHRGPNNFGSYSYNNVKLFHFRLSILDLSDEGNQPFVNEQSDNVLVYNGEVYNYLDLKSENKIQTQSTTDTEVIINLLDHKGVSCLESFNGIFAFSYLNKKNGELILARDRFGVKPLYFLDTKDYFVFSSEAKVIYNFLEELKICYKSLHEFIWYGSSIGEETIVQGVKKVKQGSWLSINLQSFSIENGFFWKPDLSRVVSEGHLNYSEVKGKTEQLLIKAVQRQCISDVPVGAYLSGGVDSALVVSLASRFTEKKIQTFTSAFEGSQVSELGLAKKIAHNAKTEHTEVFISTKNLVDDLEAIVFQYDEPFADAAALPLHLMARECKSSISVVLQGDGGDEIFGGYGRYLDLEEERTRKPITRLFSKIHPNKRYRELMKKRAVKLNMTPEWKRMAYLVAHQNDVNLEDVFYGDLGSSISKFSPFDEYKRIGGELQSLNPMQRMMFTDMQIILSNTFMDKVDKINMFHSIESRVPLLDNDLVDFIMYLPNSFKIKNGVTKHMLRDIANAYIPNEVLTAKKVSFGTPMSFWIKNELYDFIYELFEKSEKKWGKVFSTKRLLSLLREHKLGLKDHSDIIWRSVVLLIWMNRYQQKVNFTTIRE